jgi:dCTP deaminase
LSQLCAQSIDELCRADAPMIDPYFPVRMVINGKSAGLSAASYDCRIAHDLVLGVNPAFVMMEHFIRFGFTNDIALRRAFDANPPMKALAYTIEDFHMPAGVSGAVCDKSSFARVFVTAFNTFFDPGFWGNATLELVNLGDKPVRYMAGDPVCQFIFTWLDKPTDRPYDGKYQHQSKRAQEAIYELV